MDNIEKEKYTQRTEEVFEFIDNSINKNSSHTVQVVFVNGKLEHIAICNEKIGLGYQKMYFNDHGIFTKIVSIIQNYNKEK